MCSWATETAPSSRGTTIQRDKPPSSVAVADLKADGKLDLAVTNNSNGVNSVSVLLGNGDGTFRTHVDCATGTGPTKVVTADFDGDGFLDLAIANEISQTVSILGGNGDGTFQPRGDYPTGSFPTFVAVADFNEDGAADLVVVNSSASNAPNPVNILLNTQGTTISAQPSNNPSIVGQTVTFYGTAEGSLRGAKIPTGTVTLSEGSTVLGTATLAAGQFTAVTNPLTVGTHSLFRRVFGRQQLPAAHGESETNCSICRSSGLHHGFDSRHRDSGCRYSG